MTHSHVENRKGYEIPLHFAPVEEGALTAGWALQNVIRSRAALHESVLTLRRLFKCHTLNLTMDA